MPLQFEVSISDTLKLALPQLRLVTLEIDLSAPAHQLWPSTDIPHEAVVEAEQGLSQSFRALGYSKEKISQMPAIQAGRKAYRALGKDPTKYRLSCEKLLRRYLDNEGFPFYSGQGAPFVDLANLISLGFQCPVGAVDRACLSGNLVTVDAGRPGESFISLSGNPINIDGLIVSRDQLGPFGSTTSDSNRSGIKGETQFIQMIVFLLDPTISRDAVVSYAINLVKSVDKMVYIREK